MSGARVLVVDDDREMRRALRNGLGQRGYAITAVTLGESAVATMTVLRPDVVLIDIPERGFDGLELCRAIRARWSVPVIMLSFLDDEYTKVEALNAGADDYLTKPFGLDELEARIRVGLRRELASTSGGEPVFCSGDLVIDAGKRLVTLDGAGIHLTPNEYHLLKQLAVHADRTVTHAQISREMWGVEDASRQAMLRYTVGQLRRKLHDDADHPRYILTDAGVGYWLAVLRAPEQCADMLHPSKHDLNSASEKPNAVPTR